MKKFLTSTGLVALSISGVHGAISHDLSAIESSKPWSVSAALRGFYDDNYTTSPNDIKRESFGYEFTPSVSLNLPFDQTFFGVSYEYSLKYYEDRRPDHYDQSHKFDLRLDHSFSERYKIEVNDSFVIAQEPEVLSPGGGALATPLRTDGDNIRNLGSIDFSAQMTELLALELGYANTFYDYQQENNGDEFDQAAAPSRSALLDRIEQKASIDLRWQMLPETDGIVGYSFGMVDFTSNEKVGLNTDTGETISADIRNSRSHQVYVGADHRFSSRLNGSIRVGGQYTDYYNQGDNSISPYADANLTYQYGRGDYIQVGINHTRNRTDVASFDSANQTTLDQEATAIYGNINHKFTPNLVGSLLVQGQRSTFQGGSADGDVEYFLISGLNLTYHFNPHLLAEAGYNFDRLDSDVLGRSYSRNRVYLGVRATY